MSYQRLTWEIVRALALYLMAWGRLSQGERLDESGEALDLRHALEKEP